MEFSFIKNESLLSKYINTYTRSVFFLVGDTLFLFLSALLAYLTLSPLTSSIEAFPYALSVINAASIIGILAALRMYMATWRHTSIIEFFKIVVAVVVGTILSQVVSSTFFEALGTHDHIFTVLMSVYAILFISGFRISKRLVFELLGTKNENSSRSIIFGAENEGEQILRDVIKNEKLDFKVLALFDDRVVKGLYMHGVRVLGGGEEMVEYVENHPVDQLIVAYPEYPKKDLKEIISKLKKIRPELDIKILPAFHSLSDDPVSIKNIRDIKIEDVLGREPININMDTLKKSIYDKKVLVTGAGGSIGSELIRQCANLNPSKLIALDIDETELFKLQNECNGQDKEIIPCVACVTDEQKIDKVLKRFKPDVIFHAAAYKHVPMMESFPEEAIRVNVLGTRTVASAAIKHNVDKFIMVSTDKAVNPTNVMGATKRIAEEICMCCADDGSTKFMSVRFGNVLGSRGSVIPIFIDQIKNGGPVTVTHPEMKRYFMTIPEAVLLVMQAGSMGEGGEVFVLDMGEPVKIMDMAQDLIKLHNLKPGKDIAIEIVGRRPGEKLFEELLNAEEGVTETDHDEIFKAKCSKNFDRKELDHKISELVALLHSDSIESVRAYLKTLVPSYSFKTNGSDKSVQKSKNENKLAVIE